MKEYQNPQDEIAAPKEQMSRLEKQAAEIGLGRELTEKASVNKYQNLMPRILVVDDNELLLEMITEYLILMQFQVDAVRSGAEMFSLIPEIHPDVILLDIQMPGMDGLEAARRIRGHADPRVASIPIVAITALAMPGDRERCLAAGVNEYFSKPLDLPELAKTILVLTKK